jgi:lysophospholipase L1-like esterase
MKVLLSLLAVTMFAAACNRSPVSHPADNQLFPVSGRFEPAGEGSVRLHSAGATMFVKFKGASLSARLTDPFRDGAFNYISVIVDGKLHRRFPMVKDRTSYVLADSLTSGWHLAEIVKDTEGQNGWIQIDSLQADSFEAHPELPSRRIEFIGNSVTCGMGAYTSGIPCEQANWFDQHHAAFAFGPVTARRLNAQYLLAAVSGMGVFRNWNSDGPVMKDAYPFITTSYDTSGTRWDGALFPADLVVIGLGTNDFSDGAGPEPRASLPADPFVAAYADLIRQVVAAHPKASILCTSSPMLDADKNNLLESYVRKALEAVRITHPELKTTFYRFHGRYNAGCTTHPSAEEHLKIAEELIPAVAAFMAW